MSSKNPKFGDGENDAMEVVVGNEDLLIQILLFLPPKSLLCFKSVSKAWLSLISSTEFRRRKSKRFRKVISGLISSRPGSRCQEYDFFPLKGGRNPPFERLDFVDGESDGLMVLQSCNGLLLCMSPGGTAQAPTKYYVINPTTKGFTTFSGDDVSGTDRYKLYHLNLAFDPRKSIHFKLICIYVSYAHDPSFRYFPHDEEIRIFSSETGLMTRVSGVGFSFQNADVFSGVYWNDAINWIDEINDGCYFNVNEQRLGILPMPPIAHVEGWDEEVLGRWIRYYGESNDHLYFMCTVSTPTQFHVYEMDRGYSGWSLRFIVDLQPVFSLYPEAVKPLCPPSDYLHPNRYRHPFEILGIVDKDDDDDESYLVLLISGKAIRYNLKDKSFSKIQDYASGDRLGLSAYPRDAFQFIESLHPL